MRAKTKYGSRKIIIDGIVFDSVREGNRYAELKLFERAGKIKSLRRQVKYLLIPSQYEAEVINGKMKNRCVERACIYIADFVYMEGDDLIVEDCKGFRTEAYIIKRKLMLQNYGIRIRET